MATATTTSPNASGDESMITIEDMKVEPDQSTTGAEIDDAEEDTVSDTPSSNPNEESTASSSTVQSGNSSKNRRKRKCPQKVTTDDGVGAEASTTPPTAPSSSSSPPMAPPLSDFVNLSIPLPEFPDPRIESRMENSNPRSTCPICGDKANGLHYGIYSCEGCKNFFKRSVVICQDRPYTCKFNNECNVGVFEADGIKRQRVRCQACRYQACIDAGMYHSGIPRTRGGRHGYSSSPIKNGFHKSSPPPLPPASAISNNHVTISPVDYDGEQDSSAVNVDDNNRVWQELQIKQLTYTNIDLQHQIEMLKSKNRELMVALNEKDTQLSIAEKQIHNLQNNVKNISAANGNANSAHDRDLDGGAVARIKSKLGNASSFNHGNGAVTITPVIAGSNDKMTPNERSLYEDDMATIEAVNRILSRSKNSNATTIKRWKMGAAEN